MRFSNVERLLSTDKDIDNEVRGKLKIKNEDTHVKGKQGRQSTLKVKI